MKYELKKLIHIRMLWILAAMLLVSDVILLSEYGSRQYDNGTYEYSQQDYEKFLAQIPEQTEEFKKQPAYADYNTFLYRNLIKTERDYSALTGKGFKEGDYKALTRYAVYPYHMLPVILFAFVLVYQLFPAERRKGFFLLLKSTKRGHGWLYLKRSVSLSEYIAVFSLVCDITELLFVRYRYGTFGLDAIIQSSSMFRNCQYSFTVGTAIAVMAVIHILAGIFCVLFIQMLFSVLRRNEISLTIYTAFFVAEWILSQRVSVSGRLNILLSLNPFYQCCMKTSLGNHLNIDIFGYPISQMAAGIITLMITGSVLSLTGIAGFSLSFQTESESLFHKMMLHLRRKMGSVWHTDHIAVFEFRKIMIHERRVIITVIFILVIVGFSRKALSPLSFKKASDAEYHRLVNRVQGIVTNEKLDFIESERAELDSMLVEAQSLGNSEEDKARKLYIQYEMDMRDVGLSKLEQQRDTLLKKESGGKYFFDEEALTQQFYDIDTDLLLFLIAGNAIVITVCGLESADSSSGMYSLLDTTSAGYAMIRRKKRKVVYIIALIYYIFWNIPDFLSYVRIDKGVNLMAPFTQLTTFMIKVPVSELCFFIMLAVLRLALYMALTAFMLKTTIWFRSASACGITGTLVILMISIIAKMIGVAIVVMMINVLSGRGMIFT